MKCLTLWIATILWPAACLAADPTPKPAPTARVQLSTTATPTAIHAGGQWRKLGGLKPAAAEETKAALRMARPAKTPPPPTPCPNCAPVTPRLAPVLDQNGYSCCASCAGCQALYAAEGDAVADSFQHSVCDLYYRVNGGVDDGSTLYAVATALDTAGVCTTNTATMWGVSDPQHHGAWEADRLANKPSLVTSCTTLDEINSELAHNHVCIVGIDVNESFAPDASGVIGPRRPGPGGGHCVFLIAKTTTPAGDFYLTQNSWGTTWGTAGRCQLHASWIAVGTYGAYSFARNRDCCPTPPPPPPGPSPRRFNRWYPSRFWSNYNQPD